MDLSIVIVNYKVKHFLEQCLNSVYRAAENCSTEIFAVDNKSVNGSAHFIRDNFPEVLFIENKENVGFSKANNQAIRLAKGKYILPLNPDTNVEENTFPNIIRFMESNPKAGVPGVKIIDGKGNFLPESKRGLPSPWLAFYKIFGLSKLFPKSNSISTRLFKKTSLPLLDTGLIKNAIKDLPFIKSGILNPGDLYSEMEFDFEKKYQLNILYAKDYSILNDAEILLKGLKYLD